MIRMRARNSTTRKRDKSSRRWIKERKGYDKKKMYITERDCKHIYRTTQKSKVILYYCKFKTIPILSCLQKIFWPYWSHFHTELSSFLARVLKYLVRCATLPQMTALHINQVRCGFLKTKNVCNKNDFKKLIFHVSFCGLNNCLNVRWWVQIRHQIQRNYIIFPIVGPPQLNTTH